jgi:flagellar biosynthetic protein FlhB
LADNNRTEKGTPRRHEKARERGQVPRSREVSATLSLLAALLVLSWLAPKWVPQWRALWREQVSFSLGSDLGPDTYLLRSAAITLVYWIAPILCTAWLVSVGAMFAQGGFVFAPTALSANLSRLNPVNNLKRLFSPAGLSRVAKSLVPLAFIGYLGFGVMARDWHTITRLPDIGRTQIPGWIFHRVYELGWKSCGVLLVWASIDYILQRRSFEKSLRMTKQEVKDEHKELDGNPAIKRRIRQLQRQMRRRRLLKAVRTATVVITNPTHYAIALRYELDAMAAPIVVAKGADLIAQEIRRIALWQGIPIVENKPLAQLLYRSVEEGQFIPAKLYAAVAEILAFVFQMQARRQSPGGPGPGRGGNVR